MGASGNGLFIVGHWLVEPELDRITSETESSHLRPQVMELLVYRVKNSGRIVE